MNKKQRLMTDFFKPKIRNSQTLITDFFKPQSYVAKKSQHYSVSRDYAQSYKYFKKHKSKSDAIRTHRGYCYRATGDFNEYNVYTTFDKFVIYQGKKIFIPAGTRIATASIDSDSALTHISVDSLFRKQGIGTQLIRFINTHAPQFHVYAGIEHNSRYRLTQEGAALIQSCQRKGILDDEQVILHMVPTSPTSSMY